MSEDMSERLSEDMSERMSEDMSERLSEDMSEKMSEEPDTFQEMKCMSNSPHLTGDEADRKSIVAVLKCPGGDHSK